MDAENFEADDQEECAEDPGILLPQTLESYMVYIKKFAAFLNLDGDKIPK
jgi:hypothetical protein